VSDVDLVLICGLAAVAAVLAVMHRNLIVRGGRCWIHHHWHRVDGDYFNQLLKCCRCGKSKWKMFR
jgi:hypothetical protein